jgi:hypothetical protein
MAIGGGCFMVLQWAEGHFEIWGAASSQAKSQHTKPTILHQPWRPSPPHMTTFPWSYGSDNSPIERNSLLLYAATVGNFFLPLDLRRRVAYVAAHNTAISRQPWPPPMLYPSPYEHLPTDLRPRHYTHESPSHLLHTTIDNKYGGRQDGEQGNGITNGTRK